jgi:lysophospholipase L1-like esterase
MQVKDSYCCVVYGDSISKGVIFDEVRKRYVVSHQGFSELLQQEFKGVIHTVGKFGNTTTGAVEKLERHVIEKRPDIVLLEFGGNDCDFNWEEIGQNPFKDHKPKTEIPVFCTLFKKIIGNLRENNITPVLLTLPPLDAERYFKWVSKENPLYEQNILKWLETISKIYWWHERYNAAIIQIAEETNTKWIDVRGTFLKEMDYRSYICVDGIHPNEKGHHLIARKILAYTKNKYDFLMKR